VPLQEGERGRFELRAVERRAGEGVSASNHPDQPGLDPGAAEEGMELFAMADRDERVGRPIQEQEGGVMNAQAD